MTIENVTPEQLVEFLGGEINIVDGNKIWTSPDHQFEHPKYICRMVGNMSRDFSSLTIIAEERELKKG